MLGSRGSVVHLWREQAARGEPPAVTDPRCTRFWLTLEQAVDLVILALREMQGGEVFVPRCPSSPIGDLVAATVGPKYLGGIIQRVGLRAGERLHETLISNDEARTTYDRGSHFVIAPESPSWGTYEHRGALVPEDFSYRSDANPLTVDAEALRGLVA